MFINQRCLLSHQHSLLIQLGIHIIMPEVSETTPSGAAGSSSNICRRLDLGGVLSDLDVSDSSSSDV